MAHRSNDIELVRSVGSPSVDEDTSGKNNLSVINDGVADEDDSAGDPSVADNIYDEGDLPQCRIKRNYSCNLCPFFSQNPRSYLYHTRDVHFDKIKIFECPHCLYASKHSQKLQRHINMIHVANKGKVKRSPKTVKPEKKKDFRPIKPKPPDVIQESVQADDLSTSILENVLKTSSENGCKNQEMDDGDFKCSLCNFKNKNQKLVRRHEKIVHLKKRFLRCSKCSYVTHVKARYTKHVKYHSMPMIKCDLCDFRTPYKWNLDRHYKNHCGSGAFQCFKCNFRADIKQSLTVHEMNHHNPPVGQGAIMARKKNKVGASEILDLEVETDDSDKDDLELLNYDKEVLEAKANEEDQSIEKLSESQTLRNVKVPYSSKRESANNSNRQTDFIDPDDIVPRNGQIFVKNLKCKFCSYKAVFSREIWRHEKRIHGYIRPETKKETTSKRPPPKLIPIQNKPNNSNQMSSPILKIPAVRNKSSGPSSEAALEKTVNEKEFNEMCKKSCLTSSLKDFVSLIGDEEGLKTIPDSSQEILDAEFSAWDSEKTDCSAPKFDEETDSAKQKQTDMLKKKNASFFDKLKEKLLTVNNEEQSLFCGVCGHESKCLSEAVAHQKRHSNASYKSDTDCHTETDIILSGAELSSTRCQHCRQRCKTSTDLINHLKSCKAFGAAHDLQTNFDETKIKIEIDEEKFEEKRNSMENRVFVWNDIPQVHEEEEREGMDVDVRSNEEFPVEDTPTEFQTEISKKPENTEAGEIVVEVDPRLNVSVKKVFKCPHCSFWASTASRFHVHIVGHLNKKPFECSLCQYRSNWRWDITKHIRLKSARDPKHLEAKVNMTDETGRRNYSKYNKYLTMMKVQESTAESSGTGKRSRPCDATQGNVGENDIIPLPAPPRLTRAPAPGVSHQVPQGLPLRPPPPLKAAHHISPQPKIQQNLKTSAKKTLWKCKKCNFRNPNKDKVLAHVKEHYEKKNETASQSDPSNSSGDISEPADEVSEVTILSESNTNPKSQLKIPIYKCGHCHQVSNWKHVIQRHCRLKHNGDALIQTEWRDGSGAQKPEDGKDSVEGQEEKIELISCDICPFTTDSEGDLTAHKLNHVDRPGSIFKCSYCPFYVPSKIAVLEHMEIHGVGDGCDLTTLKIDNVDPSEFNKDYSPENVGSSDAAKKYKCRQCPYLSNNRTQFLYHKQFHRPQNAPFKCMHCSYNVSRRHLLHQHLRVHHIQKVKETEGQFSETLDLSSSFSSVTDMSEIPQVWVFKAGNFIKMFKCRWCPHVNVRRPNIHEHEKMHQPKENKDVLTFECTECNYSCTNGGVLASHVKVHQGFYGQIRCLVDPTRSDEEQIEELQNSLEVVEPEILLKVDEDACPEEPHVDTIKNIHDEPLSSQPENAYSHKTKNENNCEVDEESNKVLSFCGKCPARFFFKKELRIHSKFHMIHLPFRCQFCTYTARQRPHLLAHYKVHTQDYQDRTTGLVQTYSVSTDSPQPKTAILTKNYDVIEGPVWTVTPAEPLALGKKGEKSVGKTLIKHACHRCPATFFKFVALQYHLTLHGASYPHKCKYCDYSVKTYGNLIKHQLVHEDGNSKEKTAKFSYSFPISGTDLYQQQTESVQKDDSEIINKADDKKEVSQSNQQILGSPEFVYPTYYKNGKVKQKKYKCHKCPSAFEKRDQYWIHLSLHGAKQKYKCEKCDYSVKYYANYVQHIKKHKFHDEAIRARNVKTNSSEAFKENSKPIELENKQICDLTNLEQQTFLVQNRRKSLTSKEDDKKIYFCSCCPYTSNRKDAVDNHSRRHFQISGVKSSFECPHCDYSATQGNFLRDHIRLHFNNGLRHKVEAYMRCEKMEIWSVEEKTKDNGEKLESKLLLFQDKGEECAERFVPPCERYDSQDESKWKMFVNPKTGDPAGEETEEMTLFAELDSDLCNAEETSYLDDDLIEMIEVPSDELLEVTVEKAKPRVKRWRGKNWKCKKCPHAFAKRDQFLRHIALHGSNQRHNCDVCDYSVKFYTNYVQHMKMHQTHEPDKVILVKKNKHNSEEKANKQKREVVVEAREPNETDLSNHEPSMAKTSVFEDSPVEDVNSVELKIKASVNESSISC